MHNTIPTIRKETFMQRLENKHLALLFAGTVLMSMSFILKHYFALSDSLDGFVKGIAIGLLLLTLLLIVRHHNAVRKTNS
jgi:uncharacterized protein YybS (DUF2232 family)